MIIKDPKTIMSVAFAAALKLKNPNLLFVLGELAKISSLKFNDKINSACITHSHGIYTIEFSPEFIEKYIYNMEGLLFVLLHEIYHKIRGDFFRLLPEPWSDNLIPYFDEIANMVEDIKINSLLLREYIPDGIDLLTHLYSPFSLPEMLMLPPEFLLNVYFNKGKCLWERSDILCWDETELMEKMGAVFGKVTADREMAIELSWWHIDAWINDASTENLFCRLFKILLGCNIGYLLFLGDHEKMEEKFPLPDCFDALKKNESEDRLNGSYGISDSLEEDNISPQTPLNKTLKICKKIMKAIDFDMSNPRQVVDISPLTSVIPNFGRRECLFLTSNVWPFFFNYNIPQQIKDESRVHTYIDVSASTDEIQPFVYGLFRELGDLTGEPVYLFSNRVVEVSLKELSEGVRRTTGGTDFDCVIEHACINKFRKIVIVTDGFGRLKKESIHKALLNNIKIFLILTVHNPDSELKKIAFRTLYFEI